MVYHRLSTIYLTALVAAGSLVSAALDKPSLRKNLDDFTTALTNVLPSASYNQSAWNPKYIAEPCKFEAEQNGIELKYVWSVNVTYEDCGVPYVFCFHSSLLANHSKLIQRFGQVPPRMRQYVRTISFIPGDGRSAYARGPDLVMKGFIAEVGIYIHETTHSTEWGNAYFSNAPMADQAPWNSSYNADSAVPDDYARTNQRENLAQHPMFILYSNNIGDPRQLEPNYNRIINQQNTLRSEAENAKYGGKMFQCSKGTTCTARYAFPNFVLKQTPAKFRRSGSALDLKALTSINLALSRQEYAKLGVACIDIGTFPNVATTKKTDCQFAK